MKNLSYYLRAGYPAIWIKTWEESRAIEELSRIASEQKLELKVWSITKGFMDKMSGEVEEIKEPFSALEWIEQGEKLSIYALQNFHHFTNNPMVMQKIKDLIPVAKSKGIHLIFISSKVELPMEIEKEVAVIELTLPKREELEESLNVVIQSVDNLTIEETVKKNLTESALGLTRAEAENAFAFAYVKNKSLDEQVIQIVQREKANVIKKSGILEYIQPDFSLDDIGGLNNLKEWLDQRKRAFTDEAKAFGLPAPRGVLLVGVPGAGKSLTAKAISASWGLPLLRFDLGRVFGSLVGQSEHQMRNALQMAETVSPCILWIDEMEKGLSGMNGSADSGVTARVFGNFLTWMQEKTAPVFVFATANNVSSLPPEILRKGRFDELFFVDLPNEDERGEIFKIHLEKRKRDSGKFDLESLVKHSDGYGGAEIEESIISGLYAAFAESRELTTEDILNALKETTPLSETMKEEIQKVRDWAKTRARNASKRIVTKSIEYSQRHLRL